MKRIADHLGVFLAWAVNTALGFWVMVVARQALMSTLAVLYVGDSVRRAWVARFWGQAYYVVAGLAYLVFIFLIDGYLKDGTRVRDVLPRFALVAGVELLILFLADVINSLTQQSLLGTVSLILLPVEGVLGIVLLVVARAVRRSRRRHSLDRV